MTHYKGENYAASLDEDGTVRFRGHTFDSVSAYSLFAKRISTPGRQADDGWKCVYQGNTLLADIKDQYAGKAGSGAKAMGGAEGGAAAAKGDESDGERGWPPEGGKGRDALTIAPPPIGPVAVPAAPESPEDADMPDFAPDDVTDAADEDAVAAAEGGKEAPVAAVAAAMEAAGLARPYTLPLARKVPSPEVGQSAASPCPPPPPPGAKRRRGVNLLELIQGVSNVE